MSIFEARSNNSGATWRQFVSIPLRGRPETNYLTSCGARHNKPRPIASRGLPELTQNVIRSSHGHSTPSLKISCKSIQPFSRKLADKETKKEIKKETKKSSENNTPSPYRGRGNNCHQCMQLLTEYCDGPVVSDSRKRRAGKKPGVINLDLVDVQCAGSCIANADIHPSSLCQVRVHFTPDWFRCFRTETIIDFIWLPCCAETLCSSPVFNLLVFEVALHGFI